MPELRAELQKGLVDSYRIDRELGRGGMATVFLAYDIKHDRSVALKVLRPELAALLGPERFRREIALTAQLKHPNILPLFDSGDTDGFLFYTMPCVEGESLRHRLTRESQLPVAEALRIATEVADALDYAHDHGVIHRDIKPENILLQGGHAVVADFGVAKAITEAVSPNVSSDGMAVGTPLYMSPEQATAARQLDGRADVYSLGCVLYEMLAGAPPFTGSTAQAIAARHAVDPVPPLRTVRNTVTNEVEDVIARALAKVPADRFASAGAFAEALTAAAGATSHHRLRRSMVLATGITLTVVAILLLRSKGGGPEAMRAELDPTHIAVLYFDDLTPDRTPSYAVSGLTEGLIDALSQVSALHVISPNGVRPFRQHPLILDSIAAILRVGTVVGGSVASTDSVLRLTVRLVDAGTGRQIQSRTLVEPVTSLFRLQDTLTAEVARFLREHLGREVELREQRRATRSARAWELMQQAEESAREGRAMIREGDARAAVALTAADSLYRRAEGLDPPWLAPTLGRGRVAISLAFVSPGPGVPSDSTGSADRLSAAWIRQGLDHAERALRRQPTAPEALALRGELRYVLAMWTPAGGVDSLLPLAERDLRTALEDRPDLAHAWSVLANLYYQDYRFADAATVARRALDADAYLTEAPSIVQILFYASLYVERRTEAESSCRTGTVRFPSDPRFKNCPLTLLGWYAAGKPKVTEAWRLVHDIEQRDSQHVLASTNAYRRMMVAAILARTGMKDSARSVVERARAEAPPTGIALEEAYVNLLLNEPEAALRNLEDGIRADPPVRKLAAQDPRFGPLRSDPRFRALVRPGT